MPSHIEYYGSSSNGGMVPNGGSYSQPLDNLPDVVPMQSGRPMSVCSGSSCGTGGPSPNQSHQMYRPSCSGSDNPKDLDDELLTTLSVRELNKRLHGCPREEVRI